MSGAVENRANQIVHRRVHHHESLLVIFLHVENAREQHAGRANERPTGLDQQAATERPDDFGERPRVRSRRERGFVRIADAEAAADVNVFEANSIFREVAHERRKPRERTAIRRHAENLGAEMRGDPAPHNPAANSCAPDTAAALPANPRRICAGARRWRCADGRPRARRDSRARPQRGGRRPPRRAAPLRSAELRAPRPDSTLKSRIPLRREPFPGVAQRGANFFARFPHARENDAIAGNADAAQAVEFAAGNDVEAAAEPREHAQHG